MTTIEHLRTEPYRRLFQAARRSLEQNNLNPTGRIGLTNPTLDERRAIAGITGILRDSHTKRISVDLEELDSVLFRATGMRLAPLIEKVTGTGLIDRKQSNTDKANAIAALRTVAEKSSLYAEQDWFRQWVKNLGGQLTRLVSKQEQHRLAQAVQTLEVIANSASSEHPLLLPALAESITGNTKDLQRHKTLASLVLRALANRAETELSQNAEQTRQLWATANVVVDDLASRVLVLNIPAAGHGLGQWLTGAARYGTPFQITLHQLMTLPIQPQIRHLYICENPAILRRAAQELGPACPPMACTEGQPSVAIHNLVSAATKTGAEVHYHGDFDWPGISMTNAFIRKHNATPWQMTAGHYESGVRDDLDQIPLNGKPVTATWEPALSELMAATGASIFEENARITDSLILNLRTSTQR